MYRRHLKTINRIFLMVLFVFLSSCFQEDTPAEIGLFCDTLAQVNAGSVNTDGLSELAGHALVIETLLESSPSSIHDDFQRVHETIDAWAGAVNGDKPMIKTFEKLNAPTLIGSEGRITDYIAKHCGISLGGRAWVEAERPSAQTVCEAWPRIGTPLTFNNFPNLPDIAGSNYFSNTFIISKWAAKLGIDTLKGAFVVEPGGKAVIRGQYPNARYFAFHPNDMDLNNLKTLRDNELQPDEGSVNPFQQVVEADAKNYYTATLEFSEPASEPARNTSYVGFRKDGIRENQFVMNLMRLYHIDSGDRPGSGGVPLPAMSIYDSEGERVRHFDECDLFAPGVPQFRTEQVFPAMPVIDHRPKNPPVWSTSSNFEAPSDTLANADVQYLNTQYSRRFGSIFVVRAKYLTAPDTRGGESPAAPGRQVRLYNLCTYNFWNGGATQCILENVLKVDTEGYYTLVVSDFENVPNNLAAHDATWLDWGPYLDGQLQYRYVYRENDYVRAIAEAVN
ncbi:MAG: hypothetical protein V7709_08405, partial [Halioglobus sp.]